MSLVNLGGVVACVLAVVALLAVVFRWCGPSCKCGRPAHVWVDAGWLCRRCLRVAEMRAYRRACKRRRRRLRRNVLDEL